jgi:hypothetical protein
VHTFCRKGTHLFTKTCVPFAQKVRRFYLKGAQVFKNAGGQDTVTMISAV